MYRKGPALVSISLITFVFLFLSVSSALSYEEARFSSRRMYDPAEPGPYAVGFRKVRVPRANHTHFDSLVYYPAASSGWLRPVDSIGAPYPAVVFAHGYLSQPWIYYQLLSHLVSWGYVVVAPASELGFFPSHVAFAGDLSASLDWMEIQNADPASFLYQTIDIDRVGASGHSMGGGVSILAAAEDRRFRAVFTLGAVETFPYSAVEAVANIEVPVAFLAASDDVLVGDSIRLYDNAYAPRLNPILIGGNHWGFAGLWGGVGSMDAEIQLEITRRWLNSYFGLYLKHDGDLAVYVWGSEMTSDLDVDTAFDAGFTLDPHEHSVRAVHGRPVEHSLLLTNTGDLPTSYTLRRVGGEWPVLINTDETDTLKPGDSEEVRITVTPPASPISASDTVTILATDVADGLTSQASSLTTHLP
jgi:dienelactone hydrolase